jgi:tetratricopeptide (TPR) repeat protein
MRIRLFVAVAACVSVCFCYVPQMVAQQDDSSPQASRQDQQDQKKENTARATEESSSKDTRVDLSAPKDDEKNHPMSAAAVSDAQEAPSDVQELHPWDPHKAAKDVEVGDYYFKRKNYKAAIERYKHALIYKQDDAVATYRLAESFDKTGNPTEAVTYYRAYLKILPHGPYAVDAQRALGRLTAESQANAVAK